MERNIHRINGVKMDLARLSDEELASNILYANSRRDAAEQDMYALQGELHRRFNVELPLGETAVLQAIEGPGDGSAA